MLWLRFVCCLFVVCLLFACFVLIVVVYCCLLLFVVVAYIALGVARCLFPLCALCCVLCVV